ncbi:MAG TPA: SxtJ family membrane protein [Oligoflexia bacterium]|nr:SxtJ family membrane protein [Oligoflexia bacterium]
MIEPGPLAPERQRQIRSFALVMTFAAVAVGGFLLWRERPACLVFFALAGFVLPGGFFFPRVLGPLERAWMKFAEKLSIVMTFIFLVIFYYLAITPMALLLRIMGKDILNLKLEPEKTTYWVQVDPGPAGRHDKPF